MADVECADRDGGRTEVQQGVRIGFSDGVLDAGKHRLCMAERVGIRLDRQYAQVVGIAKATGCLYQSLSG
ncbi:MAG TPA: hypothetical protein VGJ60_28985 [Chloroflexota bacterium]